MTTLVSNPSGRKSNREKRVNQSKPAAFTSNNANESVNASEEFKNSKGEKFQPTAEQMRIASLMGDKKDDSDLKPKIEQIVELTGASREDAAVALYDCDNDMTKAIEMILDGESLDSEWQSTGRKKKTKGQVTTEVLTNGNKQPEKLSRSNKTSANATSTTNKSQRGGLTNKGNRKKDSRTGDLPKSELEEGSEVFNSSEPVKRGQGGGRRGAPRARGSRGGNRGAGRSSRTFMNRGIPSNDGFPNSIETWTNSTAEQANLNNDDLNTMTVGNWSDIAATEDWSEDDWTAPMETKVFTPSTKSIPEKEEVVENTKTLNHTSQNNTSPSYLASSKAEDNQPTMSAILAGNIKRSPAPPPSAGQALLQQIQQSSGAQNANLSQYNLSQYSKQATESIKSLVGLSSNNMISNDLMASNELDNNLTQVSKSPSQATNQNRMKVQNRTSKIPESAVEMPSNDPISNLSVHFGSLEFGTNNSFSLSSADSNIFDSVNQSAAKKNDGKNLSLLANADNSSSANFRSANTNGNANKILQAPVLSQSLNDPMLSNEHRNEKTLNANSYNPSKTTLDRKDYMNNMAYKAPYAATDNVYSTSYPTSNAASNANVGYYSNANQVPFGNVAATSQSMMANTAYNATYNNTNSQKMRDIDSNTSVQQQPSAVNSINASKPYDAASTVGTSLSLMSSSTATTNAIKNTLSSTGKGIQNVPPGVQQPTQVLSTPYLMGNTATGMPIPYATYANPYDMQFQTPARDHTYSPYAPAADVKYNRGSESEMLPVSSQAAGAVQNATQAHNQPYVNTYPPGYGFYFASFAHQGIYGAPTQPTLYPMAQAQTSANAGSAFAKPSTATNYGSHSYNSGYDSLGAAGLAQTQDYVNKSYPQQMQQHKQMSGATGADLSGNNQQSMYSKAHSQMNKSYEKQAFQAQAPAFAGLTNTAQSNLSSAYTNPYLIPHQQQMHHSMSTAEPSQQTATVGGNQRSLSQSHKGTNSNTATTYGKFNWN